MTSLRRATHVAFCSFVAFAGCAPPSDDAPPEVIYGESVCVECGMILSDERFATATIVEGARGPEPRLFDDFNCQRDHERSRPSLSIIRRWVHDHGSRAWVDADSAHYVRSTRLHTPMASGTAAFASLDDAERFAEDLDGEVVAARP